MYELDLITNYINLNIVVILYIISYIYIMYIVPLKTHNILYYAQISKNPVACIYRIL